MAAEFKRGLVAITVSLSGRGPPGFLPVLRGVLMVGLGRVVSARAAAAAECWAFLMLVPSASHCCSPSVSLTEKIFKGQEAGGWEVGRGRGEGGWRGRDYSGMLARKEKSVEWSGVECHLGVSWSLFRQQLVLGLDLIETG